MLSAGKKFVRHALPAIIKPLHVLWNEVIAFLFVSLAVLVGFSTWRKYNTADGGDATLALIMGGGFTLMLLYFGLTSFLRAKRISRS